MLGSQGHSQSLASILLQVPYIPGHRGHQSLATHEDSNPILTILKEKENEQKKREAVL